MRMIRLAVPFLLALLALPMSSLVEAQGIGGLIKKKAADAAKGKKAEPAKNDAKDPKDEGPIKSTFDCEVNAGAMKRFEEGLQKEAKQASDFETLVKGLATPDQSRACRQKEVMEPAIQKILSQGIGPNSTNAQLEAAMKKNMEDVEKHLAKKCGEDPGKYTNRDGRDEARKAGAKTAGVSEACYDKLKEFALAFCKLPEETRKAAVENGIRVPGKGSGQWVFTAEQAKALNPRCGTLVPAIEATGYKLG